MLHPFFKKINIFSRFFLPDDCSLDLKTLQQQQSQDPDLRSVYSWLPHNDKPEKFKLLIIGTLFLQAYFKRFSQLFIDDTTILISLYTKIYLVFCNTSQSTSKYNAKYY